MIRFVCSCGHRFQVDDDQAGESLQCPSCGLLVDVPTLSELGSFSEDGLYRLDADRPITDDPDRMADLGIIYSKDKRDFEGNEIDLRTLPAGRRVPGAFDDGDGDDDTGEIDLAPREGEGPDVTQRPKYDPETGELIRPLDLVKDPERDVNPATIPVAKAALTYATRDLERRIGPMGIALELLMPMNLVVMFFVLCTHVFNGMVFIAAAGLFFLWPVLLMLQGLILSHYGNVIDETGRNEQDSLPRPLRDLSFYDDLWSPFVAMFGGIMISFVIPILLTGFVGEKLGLPGGIQWLVGAAVGTVLAPAVLLTTNLSGSSLNLRPDRVLHVIRICGVHYVGVTLLWALTWPIYALGWVGFCFALLHAFLGAGSRASGFYVEWLIVLPAMVAGIYLMHYFSWYLGLLYKAHHAEFPWVLQRYERDPDRLHAARTHADQIGRRRPVSGHLVVPSQLPPTPPPPPPPQHPARTPPFWVTPRE